MARVSLCFGAIVLAALCASGCGEGDPHHAHAGHDPSLPTASSDAPIEDGVAVFSTLPDFSLVDQRGEPFDREELTGSLVVSDFIFTTCPDFCPLLTREMVALQEALAADPALEGVRLASFSVDPETDTPEALRAYAERHGSDLSRWTFVTGPRPDLVSLIQQGFKLPVVENPDEQGSPFLHSDRFVLTDAEGRIRGYYPALDAGGRHLLLADLRRLASAGS